MTLDVFATQLSSDKQDQACPRPQSKELHPPGSDAAVGRGGNHSPIGSQFEERLYPWKHLGTLVRVQPRLGAARFPLSAPDQTRVIFLFTSALHCIYVSTAFITRTFADAPPLSVYAWTTLSVSVRKRSMHLPMLFGFIFALWTD